MRGCFWTVTLLVVTGCNQLLGLSDVPPKDAAVASDAPVDSGCAVAAATCTSADVLETCAVGGMALDTTCAWGCATEGGAHCAKLQPAGGGVTATDLDPDPGLASITIGAATIGDDGSISGLRTAGFGIVSGIDFEIRNNVAIFRFKDLTINGPVLLRGAHPIALVAIGDLSAVGGIDAQGTCIGAAAGPGGLPGETAGSGAGSNGGGSSQNCSGGGGGGHGAAGGAGGHSSGTSSTTGGAAFGDPQISLLLGGGGGGIGGFADATNGKGGGGGGAVQLAANGTITLDSVINAGGCGGKLGANAGAGGGGGAGGTILVEGVTIIIGATGVLAVNGGGGGGPDLGSDGAPGGASVARASGGIDSAGPVLGGPGGATTAPAGGTGLNDPTSGGGGGAVGRIRLETRVNVPAISPTAVLSPALGEAQATTALAVTQ